MPVRSRRRPQCMLTTTPHTGPTDGGSTVTTGMRWRIMTLQVVLVLVLAFCAAFLYWGSAFVSGMVNHELAAQKISFPASGSAAIKALPAEDAAAMDRKAEAADASDHSA